MLGLQGSGVEMQGKPQGLSRGQEEAPRLALSQERECLTRSRRKLPTLRLENRIRA